VKWTPGICGCGILDVDADGDGALDCVDGCPADAGKSIAGICGCGIPDTDIDGDGTLDCQDMCLGDAQKIDPGICGCGFSEQDTDEDGTPDCADSCPEDGSKQAPGVCGCGLEDTDTDGDGIVECGQLLPQLQPGTTPNPERGETPGRYPMGSNGGFARASGTMARPHRDETTGCTAGSPGPPGATLIFWFAVLAFLGTRRRLGEGAES